MVAVDIENTSGILDGGLRHGRIRQSFQHGLGLQPLRDDCLFLPLREPILEGYASIGAGTRHYRWAILEPLSLCGIAGIFCQRQPNGSLEDSVRRMTSVLKHRGPDAIGHYCENRIALGHTRLAIIDLTAESNQPFFSDDGRYVLVFNGEIFNYLELRDDLQSEGVSFRTKSDTEVLLKSYVHWGPGATKRFHGMWAFAIYDRRDEVLFCSRDRFGIKPFNYAVGDGVFAFASEVKSLLEWDPRLRSPNFSALSLLLRKSISGSNQETCFENVLRLPPACNLTVSVHGQQLSRYWDYPVDFRREITMEEAAEEIKYLLSNSVQLRLRSDVPIGITLSSGLDSSSIAALARRHSSASFVTYTANYRIDNDEAPIALELSRSLQMLPRLISVEPEDVLGTLRNLIWHLETPHASPAVIPYWHIMEAVAKETTVVLEGQGADELFAGYTLNAFPLALWDRLSTFRWNEAAREFVKMGRTMSRHKYVGNLWFVGWLIRSMFPYLHVPFRHFRGDESVYGDLLQGAQVAKDRAKVPSGNSDALNRYLCDSMQTVLVDLLHYGDAISMAHSVESRLPFLDYQLVEFAASLPGSLKLTNGYGKEVVRRAVEDYVPAHVVRNPIKLGFPTPINAWFRDNPKETIYPVLDSPECRRRGVFNHRQMMRMVDRHVKGQVNIFSLIFRWITTELWFQEFIDKRPYVAHSTPDKVWAGNMVHQD